MRNKKLANVIGAGGHAKVVIQTLRDCGYQVIAAFDGCESKIGTHVCGVPIVGVPEDMPVGSPAVIAIGDNQTRQRLATAISGKWLTAVHPAAIIDRSVTIGEGTVVMAQSVVQVDAMIGRHAILNTSSVVDHECAIGDYVHLCPGVTLPGEVSVFEGAMLGTGVVAKPGVTIGEWSVIGAGSVVVRDVPGNSVAMGCPARITSQLPAAPAWRKAG